MLALIELLGGLLLVIVLFKKTALRDADTVEGSIAAVRTRIRQITGCLVIGLPLGFYLKGGLPDVLSVFPDPSSKTWVYFVGIPLVLIVLTLILARLRKEFIP
jgi:hypothetical protein